MPRELELHYGIEITFLKPNKNSASGTLSIDETRDQVVEIVGYDETRFFRHMNSKSTTVGCHLDSDTNHLNVVGNQNQRYNNRPSNLQQDLESGSICSYNILGGGDGSISNLEESFTYRVYNRYYIYSHSSYVLKNV